MAIKITRPNGTEDILPKKPMEIKLLESKYKLDLDKINYKLEDSDLLYYTKIK